MSRTIEVGHTVDGQFSNIVAVELPFLDGYPTGTSHDVAHEMRENASDELLLAVMEALGVDDPANVNFTLVKSGKRIYASVRKAGTASGKRDAGQRKMDAQERTVKAMLDGVRMQALLDGHDPEAAVQAFIAKRDTASARLADACAELDGRIAALELELAELKARRNAMQAQRTVLSGVTVPATAVKAVVAAAAR